MDRVNSVGDGDGAKDPVEDEVELGFLEKTSPFKLQSHLFPSKFGGKPAWLSLKPLPGTEELRCGACKKQCVFLLQIFAPQNGVKACFHRTLFVFICKNPACYELNDSRPVIALRSQLARENSFYSSEPPDEDTLDAEVPHAGTHNPLCIVCGALGDKKCALCRKAFYCCKEHQTLDWKYHRRACLELREKPNELVALVASDASTLLLFPEYEIVIEPENYCEEKSEKSEKERLKEYDDFVASSSASKPDGGGEIEKQLLHMSLQKEDKAFAYFKRRIHHEPEQIIRYQRGGAPLWISDGMVPGDGDIPACDACGGARTFEFQILPQLLRHMQVDAVGASIDWGTLVLYTCEASCGATNNYQREFVWKQDYTCC